MQQQRLDLASDQFLSGLTRSNGLAQALSLGGTGGGVAGVAGAAPNARAGAGAASGLSDYPYPHKWKYQDDVTVTNMSPKAFIDGSAADAEVAEKRYGDIAQELFGWSNIFGDAVRNVTGRTLADWGRVHGNNIGDYRRPGETTIWPAVGRWWDQSASPSYKGSVTPYVPFAGAMPSWAAP